MTMTPAGVCYLCSCSGQQFFAPGRGAGELGGGDEIEDWDGIGVGVNLQVSPAWMYAPGSVCASIQKRGNQQQVTSSRDGHIDVTLMALSAQAGLYCL